MERRLAAVLAFDMVGYSRLTGVDEQLTLATFRRHRSDIFDPRAAQYHGRVAALVGDGAMMEFASVVDSVCFAVEVQLALRAENSGIPEDRQYRYRIGINIGDIVHENGDIYGDGVNVAKRTEELADAGGINLSGTAFSQVKGKLDLTFENLGEKRVKNISDPVTMYRIRLDEKAEALMTPVVKVPPPSPAVAAAGGSSRPILAATAIAMLLLVSAGGLLWWQPWRSSPAVTVERVAYPLPDKPSIAVLPFINVSSDDEHDHLAEGLTDDLITELSKVSGLFVIARHSVFALRNSADKIQEIAAELGVHFVLEGTLQQAGTRLRINVKLIDALTGLSMWAERYDREYADIFAVQDEVIGKIISALAVKLSDGERDHLARIPTANLEAYDYYLRAEHEGFLYSDVETYRRTLSFYQKAIDLDPTFAEAHAGIARIAVDVWRNDYNFLWSAAVARKIAYDAAGQALKFDPDNARAHTVLALLQLVDGRQAEAIDSANRAVELQPNDVEAFCNLALILAQAGRHDQALTALDKSLRLEPTPPPSFKLLAGVVYYLGRDNERAVRMLAAAADALPRAEPAHEYLAAAYVQRGDSQEGRDQAAKLLELFPDSNLTYYSYLYDYWTEDARLYHLAGLGKAGIPEWPFGFNGKEADRLGGPDLAQLADGKTWIGKHKNGTDFMQFFGEGGNTAYRSANTNITGTFEIHGDRLCEKFEGYFLDRLACGYVYRNTGAEEPGMGYVHVTPMSLKFFSLGS
ncbi:guanylyl cyclase [Mesorhizobium sp. L-8-10]|uniref:adenylate/guanylate cyclase domain-containing protein n=1 Tax=Mesorhizobium sp. L-8-10 TaxID=2744523 RepID=UPI0019286F6B|nr:adenylate/guanylate cyclase domain-containing protein [Mesorhizobium sp. L-8-10]BCH32532.1 guanylyl cyclase [Mesorhizobium sp. L-8-10]